MADGHLWEKPGLKQGECFLYMFFGILYHHLSSFVAGLSCVRETSTNVCFREEKPRKTLGLWWDQQNLVAFAVFSVCVFGWRERIFNIGSGLDYHGRPKPDGA